MSKVVNMHEAKTDLSRFVQQLRDGQELEVIIAVAGTSSARLVPFDAPRKRRSGLDAGLVIIAEDFDDDDESITPLFVGRE